MQYFSNFIKDISQLTDCINAYITINEWLQRNRISINIDKLLICYSLPYNEKTLTLTRVKFNLNITRVKQKKILIIIIICPGNLLNIYVTK